VSRAIQVRVSESVVRTVHVEDGVQSPIEMLPVLAPDRMADLLAAELEAQGFIRDGNTARRVDPDGIEITVDLKGATVSVKLHGEQRVKETVNLETRVGEESAAHAEDRMRDAAIGELEKRLDEKTEALRREVTGKLEKKLGDLRTELDQAVGKATVAALTERAQQLGKIEQVVQDDAGNVTIKVKL
jgi:FtsH ternary system-associated peptide